MKYQLGKTANIPSDLFKVVGDALIRDLFVVGSMAPFVSTSPSLQEGYRRHHGVRVTDPTAIVLLRVVGEHPTRRTPMQVQNLRSRRHHRTHITDVIWKFGMRDGQMR
jgi:hypothetical protein